MANKKNFRWVLVLLVLAMLGSLACCCGCAGLWHFLPDMLIAAFTEEGPLKAPVVDPDPTVGPRLERTLAAGEPVAITGEDFVQLVEPWEDEELYAFWVDVRPDDNVELALSVYIADIDRFLNIQAVGAMEIEHGWFTSFTCEEAELSGWELGQYVRGEQLAEHANRSAADQRSQDPQVAEMLDQIEHLWIADGAVHLQLAPGGWETWKRSRQ